MAMTTVESPTASKPKDPTVPISTPCDPWPRPYFFENGLRKVAPYHFTYNTWCKERWRNRGLLEIFSSEFRDRPLEYYRYALETGHVTVNNKVVSTPNDTVKNGDVISHTLHRHEPPVSAQAIGIIHEDDDIIVINKPGGIPVHPAGRYNYNCVVEIIRAERSYDFKALPCNRLDRLTSGLMFIGKHPKAADKMSKSLKDRTVLKEYVACVAGEFPEGEVVCEKPILQISPKLGLNRVRADGKSAKTVFRRLAYYPPSPSETEENSDDSSTSPSVHDDGMPWKRHKGYSIVRCLPLTGRTHQLRVHLQFLGHPIANDPIYANQRVFGPSLGADDDSASNDDDIISRLDRMGKQEVAEAVAYHDEVVDRYQKQKAERLTGEMCDVCHAPLYSDPGSHELGIWLHARKYACSNGKWSYESPLPDWALPPAGVEGPKDATDDTDPLTSEVAKLTLEKEAQKENAKA
ncbi:pseudouridine synthase [Eremomyces bilateralis CBS 781.70]|uniref:Pseudouridine synthase n=1 Tax=Eremomyces bilateralis CBS 781.70 TaxID=1392243 RepID=A0A6G1GA70_9PEZI|nr:pseudouridine synthase [Eremomyces bilateralis CBS 781.70]KAF1814924.1 pseudouridine synthase [Eremomyces bilateralis CBS 781.70]